MALMALDALFELVVNSNVLPVCLPLAPLLGGAYVALPEPSVFDHPGDELESVKLRCVSGFRESANAGAADAARDETTSTNAALRMAPRLAIDLSVYMFVYLLSVCFIIMPFLRVTSTYYH